MSRKTVSLTLPEPPSANRYWRNYRGVTVLSDTARAYKAGAKILAMVAGLKPLPLCSNCAVTLHWFRGRKSGDLDNRIKIVLDSLQGTAYQSDSQVVELHAYRSDDKANPRVEITIEAAA